MERYTIRLGSTLSFDKDKEKDIIEVVERLSSSHKLGPFISCLLRVALEDPNDLKHRDNLVEALEYINEYGMTIERHKFYKDVEGQISEMKRKVDEIYNMNLKLLTLAQFGKHLELESRTENMLRAQFILERQLEELTNILGVDNPGHIFESNKIQDTQEKSKEILEYIINTYDSLVEELKGSLFSSDRLMVVASSDTMEKVEDEADVEDDTEEIEETDQLEEQETEEYIDFGDADLDALSNFFGEV